MLLSQSLIPKVSRGLFRTPRLAPTSSRNYETRERPPKPPIPVLSPINIDDRAIRLAPYNVAPIEFRNYWDMLGIASLTNNGSTVSVQVPKRGNIPTITGGPLRGTYMFDSMHFHWGPNNKRGSEHRVNGEQFSMELHLVHFSGHYQTIDEATTNKRSIAVVAFFLHANAPTPNPALDPIVEALPKIKTAKVDTHVSAQAVFDLIKPRAQPSGYYTYIGSLLNPALGKEVIWIVYPVPIPISNSQVEVFRTVHNMDKRQIQGNCQGLCEERKMTVYYCPYMGGKAP